MQVQHKMLSPTSGHYATKKKAILSVKTTRKTPEHLGWAF
jgi:hypothetical protein